MTEYKFNLGVHRIAVDLSIHGIDKYVIVSFVMGTDGRLDAKSITYELVDRKDG